MKTCETCGTELNNDGDSIAKMKAMNPEEIEYRDIYCVWVGHDIWKPIYGYNVGDHGVRFWRIKKAVNADRDSKQDMRKVQEKFGAGSIELNALGWGQWDTDGFLYGFDSDVSNYRIAAKHATTFNPKTMDPYTFAKATIDAGDVVRWERKHDVWYHTNYDERKVFDGKGAGQTWNTWDDKRIITRITRQQMEEEQREAWPKWYAGYGWSDGTFLIERYEEGGICHMRDGRAETIHGWNRAWEYYEVTEEKAMELLAERDKRLAKKEELDTCIACLAEQVEALKRERDAV